jgi:hypothetical protein
MPTWAQILNVRMREEDGLREFLVQFPDGADDEWVEEKDMAPSVVEDYDNGLEYAVAREVVDVVQVGTERRFKVNWSDGYPVSGFLGCFLNAGLLPSSQDVPTDVTLCLASCRARGSARSTCLWI